MNKINTCGSFAAIIAVAWLAAVCQARAQAVALSLEEQSEMNLKSLSVARKAIADHTGKTFIIEPDKGSPPLGEVVKRYHESVIHGVWGAVYESRPIAFRALVKKEQYLADVKASKLQAFGYYILGFQRVADQEIYQLVTLMHFKKGLKEGDKYFIETWIQENGVWTILRGDDQAWSQQVPFLISMDH